jgi:peptidoglycan/LPS O-acetylase OafA/YrhL
MSDGSKTSNLIDARQPRLGQGITGTLLVFNFVLGLEPVIIPVLAVVMGFASLLGPKFNLYAYLFKALRSRFGPPKELEEPWPPRFANLLGFVFLTCATIAYYAFDSSVVAWGLGLLVAALALLAAITGLCVGCEFFVIGRRIATKGRVASKLVVHKEAA